MEDIKQFNKLLVKRDKTILGAASNTLKELKIRWPDRAVIIDEMSDYLLELRAMLGEEGWKGYIPKRPEPIADVAIEETLELIAAQDAEKLMRQKAEAKAKNEAELAEKKRVAEEQLKKQQEAEARKRAAEEVAKAIELEKVEKAEKKAALQAQMDELEV